MEIVGYSDRLSVAPGQRIRFNVSCKQESYEASIVRLIHGDLDEAGPGFKEERVRSSAEGTYPGRVQPIRSGSYVVVSQSALLDELRSISLSAWVYPTLLTGRRQALLGTWSESQHSGYGLFLEPEGDLCLRLGDGSGSSVHSRTRRPLRPREWTFVACSYDHHTGALVLVQHPRASWPDDPSACVTSERLDRDALGPSGTPLLIAACWAGDGGPALPDSHFNGKLSDPVVASARPAEELRGLAAAAPSEVGDVIARWDFSQEISTAEVIDVSGNGLHGSTVNMPTRAVTGPAWAGREECFVQAPEEYNAIHFHDDDLEDAGWDADFELELPEGWPSGVYAARLVAGSSEDYSPFFVRPRPGRPTAEIAFLVPTLSYFAYANDHLVADLSLLETGVADPALKTAAEDLEAILASGSEAERAALEYIIDQRLLSLYETHSDGSGACYSSRLRPNLTMRPKLNHPATHHEAPHGLNEDLYIVDWLEAMGHRFDIVTDEDLHAEGLDLLRPYRVVLTGSHPEYCTEAMWLALEAYLQGGGRLMYLGGNGFYWVTSVDPVRPHIIEIRRGESGTRTWEAEPGERFHSTTGERGGLWRSRGRPPQRLVGVGFSGTIVRGDEPSGAYRRGPGSFDPRAAFIFEGIDESELIGDFGLHNGGAAGWEVDRADARLGTPYHAIVLASAAPLPGFRRPIEEHLMLPGEEASEDPAIRADLVYFTCPNGGAVFSVGSISWTGSLSHNGYGGNVSRITANVLRRFASDATYAD
jgi:N,N-dimethylformamidase